MRNYELKSDEAIVFEGVGFRTGETEKNNDNGFSVILTNLNLVLIDNALYSESEEKPKINIIPVEKIKEYNGDIQVKPNGNSVEIFYADGEQIIFFTTKHEVRKFTDKVFEVYTGKKKTARGADKVKNAIKLVDDALGIDTVDTIKNVAQGGVVGAVFGMPIGGKKGKKLSKGERVISGILSVAQGVSAQKDTSEKLLCESKKEKTPDEQLEMLTKMKALLENGVITQEEFDAKKKQILGV